MEVPSQPSQASWSKASAPHDVLERNPALEISGKCTRIKNKQTNKQKKAKGLSVAAKRIFIQSGKANNLLYF